MLRPRYTLHDDRHDDPSQGAHDASQDALATGRPNARRPPRHPSQGTHDASQDAHALATGRPPHPGNAHTARVRSVGSGAGPEEVKRRGGRGLPRVRSVGSTAETAENTRKARSRHMGMDRGLGRVSDRGSERRGGPCRETWMDLRSERASSAGGARVTSRARGHAAVATGLPMKRGEVRSEDRS